MKLRQVVDIAEIVSAVAVVISLVYLASQIRQNTDAVRATAAQGMVDSIFAATAPVLENQEMARAFFLGTRNPEALDEVQGVQWSLFAMRVFRSWETRWFAYQQGTLDPRLFESLARFIDTVVDSPGWIAEWERHRGLFDPGFEAYLDGLIDEPSS